MSSIINSDIIYNTVKELCLLANTKLPKEEYFALKKLYENETNFNAKCALSQILNNAKIAFEKKRPLCQDTGFVTVFADIGNEVSIEGEILENVINKAVRDAYLDNFFRKSIVSDPLFERLNTQNNTPIMLHTNIVSGNEIKLTLSIKGGGCENISATKMLTPAEGMKGIIDFVVNVIKLANSKPCPPIRIGIGIGSNFEGASILSKKALLLPVKHSDDDKFSRLAKDILEKINDLNIGVMGLGGKSTCYSVNILHQPCHIASLPVAVSISCHSSRHSSVIIKTNKVIWLEENYDFGPLINSAQTLKKVDLNSPEIVRQLKKGENILLSGKVYTARDAAHKKFAEILKKNEKLPFDIKNAVIFYAGPCPASSFEIIGPIGPTTSSRMDLYAPELYSLGLLAVIGKGERSDKVYAAMKKFNGKYFTVTGGIASLLQNCVKSARIIAYPELGAEAVFELEIENLPVIVNA